MMGGQWGESYEPPVARVLMMNLGNKSAEGMKVGLRDQKKGFWGWGGTSIMEVNAPEYEVFSFLDSRHHGKQNPSQKPFNETSVDKIE